MRQLSLLHIAILILFSGPLVASESTQSSYALRKRIHDILRRSNNLVEQTSSLSQTFVPARTPNSTEEQDWQHNQPIEEEYKTNDAPQHYTPTQKLSRRRRKKQASLATAAPSNAKQYVKKEQPRPIQQNSTCLVCFEDELSPQEMVTLACGHTFCRTCLAHIFDDQVKMNTDALKCPDPECTHRFTRKEVINIVSNDPEKMRTYQQAIQHKKAISNPNIRYCPTPSCSHPYLYNGTPQLVACSKCKARYCNNCGINHAHTKGNSSEALCQKIKNATEEKHNAANARWIQQHTNPCPKCRTPIQKTYGCAHMTCKAKGCGYEFYWPCGSQYRDKKGKKISHKPETCTKCQSMAPQQQMKKPKNNKPKPNNQPKRTVKTVQAPVQKKAPKKYIPVQTEAPQLDADHDDQTQLDEKQQQQFEDKEYYEQRYDDDNTEWYSDNDEFKQMEQSSQPAPIDHRHDTYETQPTYNQATPIYPSPQNETPSDEFDYDPTSVTYDELLQRMLDRPMEYTDKVYRALTNQPAEQPAPAQKPVLQPSPNNPANPLPTVKDFIVDQFQEQCVIQ